MSYTVTIYLRWKVVRVSVYSSETIVTLCSHYFRSKIIFSLLDIDVCRSFRLVEFTWVIQKEFPIRLMENFINSTFLSVIYSQKSRILPIIDILRRLSIMRISILGTQGGIFFLWKNYTTSQNFRVSVVSSELCVTFQVKIIH